MNKSLVSPSFLKQKARQIKKEKSLSQNEALDEAAKSLGYSNYKNYLNALESNRKDIESSKDNLLKNIALERNETKKLELGIFYIQKFGKIIHHLLEVLKYFKHSKDHVQSICESSSLKNDIQASFLNYFTESKKDVQALPLMQYFVADNVSITGLSYELRDEEIYVDGNYDISFKFEFEVPDENKHLPHFYREPMFGTFGVVIDKNKGMIFDNPTIGQDIDNVSYMGSFKLSRLY